MQGLTLLYLFGVCMDTVSGCDTFALFNMPSLFKSGDIMIGGIFPIFNKEISNTIMFEREPVGTVCSGYDWTEWFKYLNSFCYILSLTSQCFHQI